MSRLDTWKPGDKQQWNEALDDLLPTESPEVVARRADALVRTSKKNKARKLFIERRAVKRESTDQTRGKCEFCLQPTTQEFCSEKCERDAGFAGLPLKFENG